MARPALSTSRGVGQDLMSCGRWECDAGRVTLNSPPPEPDPDPLYDPMWMIFIYSGWVGLASLFNDLAGLLGLIGLTALLTVFALAHPQDHRPHPFVAEFGTVLLFCASSIGVAVVVLRGVRAAPELILAGLLFAASAAIVGDLLRRERRETAAQAGT